MNVVARRLIATKWNSNRLIFVGLPAAPMTFVLSMEAMLATEDSEDRGGDMHEKIVELTDQYEAGIYFIVIEC